MKNIVANAICTAVTVLFFVMPQSLRAQTGIGFGWDQSVTQEWVYNVAFGAGAVTPVGVIDGLQFVSMGSHAVEPRTGNSLMIGTKDGSSQTYLFLITPGDRRTFSFPLAEEGRSVYQQAFIHPQSGEMFLLGYSAQSAVNQVFRVGLDLKRGSLKLTLLGNLPGVEAYAVGTPKITADGKIVVPASSGGGHGSGGIGSGTEQYSLVFFDTGSQATSSLPIARGVTEFAACDVAGTPRFFGYGMNIASGIGEIFEIMNDGSVSTIGQTTLIGSVEAGSAFCLGSSLYIAGRSASDQRDGGSPSQLFVTDLESGVTTAIQLSAQNLKFVAPLKAQRESAVYASAALPKYLVINGNNLKSCAGTYRQLFKKRVFTKLGAATALLRKLRFARRGKSYSCSLK